MLTYDRKGNTDDLPKNCCSRVFRSKRASRSIVISTGCRSRPGRSWLSAIRRFRTLISSNSGVAALSVTAEGSGSVEVITLGRRDFAGYPLALGTRRSPHRTAMQMPGRALRIRADDLIELMERNEELRKTLLRHIQAMMIQSSQQIACHIKHDLKQRLPRWLLETSDKLCSDQVPVTHATAAYALGVRRAGITTAIAKLEQDGLIVHRRGSVTIVDREGLERVSCDCHRVVKFTRERCIAPSRPAAEHEIVSV